MTTLEAIDALRTIHETMGLCLGLGWPLAVLGVAATMALGGLRVGR